MKPIATEMRPFGLYAVTLRLSHMLKLPVEYKTRCYFLFKEAR